MPEFRPCALIPTYNNPRTVRDVVLRVREQLPDVVVIDDGSADEGRRAVEGLAADGLAHTHRRATNGGKGAAVKTGFQVAHALGYTHALQVDADGQHDLADIPKLLQAARERPEALVLGAPIYDASAPKGRLVARNVAASIGSGQVRPFKYKTRGVFVDTDTMQRGNVLSSSVMAALALVNFACKSDNSGGVLFLR